MFKPRLIFVVTIALLALVVSACGPAPAEASVPDTDAPPVNVNALVAAPADTSVPTTIFQSTEVASTLVPSGIKAEGAIVLMNGKSHLRLVLSDVATGSMVLQTWLKVWANQKLVYDDWLIIDADTDALYLELEDTFITQLDVQAFEQCTIQLASVEHSISVFQDSIKIHGVCQ